MPRGLLPEHIGPLVDRLRAGDHQAISLPDVAALTEILMRSLESYFKSIDLTIYQECQSLADYIDDARSEISSLSPDHSNEAGIPRAGLELAAIVQQTESATNIIMESAEQIMDADPGDAEAYSTTIKDAVLRIFEACSFQDITGQRISKVVSTLEHVEERVARLINILGVMEVNEAKESSEQEIDEDKTLLSGPALEGEGIDQSAIDDLLKEEINDDETLEIDDQEDAEAEQKADEPEVTSPPLEEEVKAEETEPDAELSENTTADDIDFMFSGGEEVTPEEEEKKEEENNDTVAETTAEVITEEAPKTKEEAKEDESGLNLIEQAKQKKAKAQAEKKAKAKPPKPVTYEQDGNAALKPKISENTTQSDIDALFS